MILHFVILAIGIVAGLRAFTAPAAVSIAAYYGLLPLDGTPLAFIASPWAAGILAVLAIVELVGDQLPSTPSRKVPVQFGTRVLMGGLAGAAIGTYAGNLWIGLVLGVIGAVIGTYGGAWARAKLASAFGKDLPAGLLEDVVAVGLAAFLMLHGL